MPDSVHMAGDRSASPVAMVVALLLASAAVARADYREAFRQGFRAKETGNHEQAVRELRAAIAENPTESRERISISGGRLYEYTPYFHLAEALHALGRDGEAVEALRQSRAQGRILETGDARAFEKLCAKLSCAGPGGATSSAAATASAAPAPDKTAAKPTSANPSNSQPPSPTSATAGASASKPAPPSSAVDPALVAEVKRHQGRIAELARQVRELRIRPDFAQISAKDPELGAAIGDTLRAAEQEIAAADQALSAGSATALQGARTSIPVAQERLSRLLQRASTAVSAIGADRLQSTEIAAKVQAIAQRTLDLERALIGPQGRVGPLALVEDPALGNDLSAASTRLATLEASRAQLTAGSDPRPLQALLEQYQTLEATYRELLARGEAAATAAAQRELDTARTRLNLTATAARQLLDRSREIAALAAPAAELRRLLQRAEADAGNADTATLVDLSAQIERRSGTLAVALDEAEQVAAATPPPSPGPPTQLLDAARAYVAGDYSRSDSLLSDLQQLTGRQQRIQALLFRAASRLALATQTPDAESRDRYQQAAGADLASIRELDPTFQPDAALFPPKVRQLLAAATPP